MSNSIPQLLCETANRLPDKIAIVSPTRSVTFSQLLQEALSTATCLREIGIEPGDRVGICMEKTLDQVSVILGVLFANAVVVPILPRLKQPNIRHIIENSQMVALVTDSDRMNEVTDFADLTKLVIGHGELHLDWPNLPYMRRFVRPEMRYDRISADNAAIIYSSGSTGRPKGILISHRNLADGAEIISRYLGTCEEDRICCVLSFNFDYGLNQIWQTILKGATLYLHNLALPNDLFALLATEKTYSITGNARHHHQDFRPATETCNQFLRFLFAAIRLLYGWQAVSGYVDRAEDNFSKREDLLDVWIDGGISIHLSRSFEA